MKQNDASEAQPNTMRNFNKHIVFSTRTMYLSNDRQWAKRKTLFGVNEKGYEAYNRSMPLTKIVARSRFPSVWRANKLRPFVQLVGTNRKAQFTHLAFGFPLVRLKVQTGKDCKKPVILDPAMRSRIVPCKFALSR